MDISIQTIMNLMNMPRFQATSLTSAIVSGNDLEFSHPVACLVSHTHTLPALISPYPNSTGFAFNLNKTIEPPFTPLSGEILPSSANIADDARVDIAARSFWQRCDKAFFDVRVFNPYASTHRN